MFADELLDFVFSILTLLHANFLFTIFDEITAFESNLESLCS